MKQHAVIATGFAGAILCACIAAIAAVAGVFRDRPNEPAEPRSAIPLSRTSSDDFSSNAISNLPLLSAESFRLDGKTVAIHLDDRSDFDPSTWQPGMKHPVIPDDPNLPNTGTNTLRAVLGQCEEWHVYNSVCGLYLGSPERIPYERTGNTTTLHFSPDWEVRIDNATGAILEPPDLPPLSESDLSDMTWVELSRDRGVERWADIVSSAAANADRLCRLIGFRLDEIRYVGDKVFVGWRLIEDPPSEDSFLRLTYWVDRRTKQVVHSGTEIHENR